MYSYESRIRYSELDETGHLKIEALLDYFQDCCTFQSEDIGCGQSYWKENHLAWVMSSWQVIVDRYPLLGKVVTIATAPYDFKGFIGYRNFLMTDQEGNRLACANTIWSLIDTQTGKPVRPSQELIAHYVLEKKLDMEYAPRRIDVPGELLKGESVVIRKHHLDTNHHVNNGQYVRIAMDSLPKACEIKQLRAEYKRQSYLGDTLIPYVVSSGEGKYVVVLKDLEENINCVVEIQEG